MIDQIRSDDPIRRKIETLGTTLSLPTVRKALGILEGVSVPPLRRHGCCLTSDRR